MDYKAREKTSLAGRMIIWGGLIALGWILCVLDRECDFDRGCFAATFFPAES
jgi:hypothetical protein